MRTSFIPDLEGKGVIPVPMAPRSEGETTQGGVLNERASRNLKYSLPDIKDLDKFRFDRFTVKRLYDLMDTEAMSDDLKKVWEDIIQQADTDTDDEENENNEDSEEDASSVDGSTASIYSIEMGSVAGSRCRSDDDGNHSTESEASTLENLDEHSLGDMSFNSFGSQ